MVNETKNNKGIVVGQIKHKISQFASDAELFQNRKNKTCKEAIQVLDDFRNKSGLKIKIGTTIIVWLGSNCNITRPDRIYWMSLWFTSDLILDVNCNYCLQMT